MRSISLFTPACEILILWNFCLSAIQSLIFSQDPLPVGILNKNISLISDIFETLFDLKLISLLSTNITSFTLGLFRVTSIKSFQSSDFEAIILETKSWNTKILLPPNKEIVWIYSL